MNEKIKTLSQKAGAIGIWNDYMPFQGMIDLDKFAELIVRECVDVLRQDGELAKMQCVPSATYTYAALNRGANVVRDHFGIEEQQNDIG
jgi:hypothetical protein